MLLLPESKLGGNGGGADRRANWNTQSKDDGLATQSLQQVVSNLVAPELIESRSVSRAISPAKAFEWRLLQPDTTDTHQNALKELRFLLLAQFLGLVEFVTYSLESNRLLPRVLRSDTGKNSMVLWLPKQAAVSVPRVLAGSLTPDFTLFPSASVQTPDGRKILKEWLIKTSAGKLRGAGADVELVEAAQVARFAASIGHLAGQAENVKQGGAWQQPLTRVASAGA